MTPLGWLGRKISTQTGQYCLSISPIDTTRYTTAPESLLIHFSTLPAPVAVYWYVAAQSIIAPDKVLLIPYSPQLPQYQSYWHDTVHYCPSTSPIDILQFTFATVPFLLIPYSPLLPQNQSYSYPRSTTAQAPVLLIQHSSLPSLVRVLLIPYSSLLSLYQACWLDIVHFCPSTSPSDMMSTTVPVPVLLIWCPILP